MKRALLLAMALLCAFSLLSCGGQSASAYAFSVNGQDEVPGEDAKPIIAAAGTYTDYRESGSCGGFDGMDKVYTYNGYRIYTTPDQNGDVIAKIEITSDAVATKEGIKVGSTAAQITAAYGESSAAGIYSYTAGNTVLQFTLRDGVVVGIVYSRK